MSNTFGRLFRVTTFGESHGAGVGCILDGCPAGLEISSKEIQEELNKRKPNGSVASTKRDENDEVEILSGVFEGKTLGTPIALLVRNQDQRSKDYGNIKDIFRPGHADYTWWAKFENVDYRGGGRASARETIGRVAAGAIAIKLIKQLENIQVTAYTKQIGDIIAEDFDEKEINRNDMRTADSSSINKMQQAILQAKKNQDSLGGVVEIIVKNTPVGLGEPVFDKLHARLAYALIGCPAVKSFEIGAGANVANKKGSENNDQFEIINNEIHTKTNNAGGVLGGISDGEDIIIRLAIKPTASISQTQHTVDKNMQSQDIQIVGRHDACVVPRFVPIAESMVALVLADFLLLKRSNKL